MCSRLLQFPCCNPIESIPQPYLIQDPSATVAPEEVVVEPNPNHSPLRRRLTLLVAPLTPSKMSDSKMLDLSRLVLKSAWKQGVFTALPAVLVITFLAFPIVSALVRRLYSNPRGTSRHRTATRRGR